MLRQDDLRKQDRRHARELRKGESSRINAILAASALALQQAALAARAEATTLATVVSTTAETLRGQVEATKNAFATSISTVVTPINKRLDELTQTQYQQQGERLAYAEGKSTDQWVISSVILGGAVLLGAGALLLYRNQGQRQVRNDSGRTNQWFVTTSVAVVVAIVAILALLGHLRAA
jgi:uncharacterized membrane protein YidH (DUF202 family)